jgi:hypothetical protein
MQHATVLNALYIMACRDMGIQQVSAAGSTVDWWVFQPHVLASHVVLAWHGVVHDGLE